jgi:4'-phosphopantetheinyl transferase EntD
MTEDEHCSLQLAPLEVPGIVIGHRLISAGDEYSLMREEADAFASCVVNVRRASGAARIVARGLLGMLGLPSTALPKSASGAPIWPQGVIGSLAHDLRFAIAAVGMRSEFQAIGIDIEPAEDLPPDLIDLIATPRERIMIRDVPNGGKLLFVAKEAAYKAVHPVDHTFLEHHDVEIDIASRKARVSNGRIVHLRFCISTHLAALAFVRAPCVYT